MPGPLLRDLEITVEFSDDLQQVVLRRLGRSYPSLRQTSAPGKTEHFEISFEHVPSSWNMQLPSRSG